jgi:hypothetical protein
LLNLFQKTGSFSFWAAKLPTQLEAGKGKRFASVDALMADLHADD